MENSPKKFIIDVIPLTRISLSRQQFFSYLHFEEIPAGTLVSIPFFRRNIEGVVIRSRSDFHRLGNFELKKIASVLAPSFLTAKQLELAGFVSEHYLCPLGISLRHFIPKRVKERARTQSSAIGHRSSESMVLTEAQQEAVDAITKPSKLTKLKARSYLLFGPASSGKTEVYIHSILEMAKKYPSAQFLILVPELTLTQQAVERYARHFGEGETVLLHSKLGKGAFYSGWEAVRSGKAKVVIGTRMALFAPFADLKLVIVDEEQDISYKQWDMNPRYDARLAAEFLAESFGAKLVFGSATPRVETFWRAQNGELFLLALPKLEIPGFTGSLSVELVDMRKERWKDFSGKKKPNYSPLSMKLQGEIAYALSHGLQAILFINHQGMNSFSVCTSCKAVLKCPKCDRALVYDEDGQYHCLHCSFRSDILVSCPACHGSEFRHVGLGTQAIVRETKKLFPGARILRADAASLKKPGAQEELYGKFKNKEADILVGTQTITKGWDLPNVALVAIMDADSMRTIPDFASDERAFEHLVQAAGRTGRPGSKYKGVVLVQTFDPLDPLLQKAVAMDYEAFFAKDMEQREALTYPPFSRLIKLVYKSDSLKKTEKEAGKLFESISRITSQDRSLAAYGPQAPLLAKIRGRWQRQILIKNKDQARPLPPEFLKLIHSLDSSWTVDIDPISAL